MHIVLVEALALLGSLLAAATFASDAPPGTLPRSPTKLAERPAGDTIYTLRARRLPRDQADPNSSLNTPFRLELQEARAGDDRPIIRLSKKINLGHEQSLPTACIGLSQEKICVVLVSPFAMWICLADRSATTDLDQIWQDEIRKMGIPKFEGMNHPTARLIRQRMHETSVLWGEIPGVTGEEATAASKAGTFRPISAESNANTWLIKFQIGEKRFLGRFNEDKDGTVTWDARREN